MTGGADREYVERNAASRERLRATLGRLSAEALDRQVDGEWTAGALLAHIAFWDRLVVGRWQLAARHHAPAPPDLHDDVADLVNDAAVPAWRSIDDDRLTALVLGAADEIDTFIEGLSDASIDAAIAAGRLRLIDRSFHRAEHLDAIDAALGS
jgi:DinB family protein